jgi:hypothetical protein
VKAPRGTIPAAALVGLLALLTYGLTLAPTVTLVDSGELIVAAWGLGVAHPPGFPLWTLLAHLFTLLPWGNVASRVHASSAVFAALASAGLVLATGLSLATRPAPAQPKAKKKRGREEAGAPEDPPTWIGPAVAGLLLAFSRTLWSYATIAEVYALATLLLAVIVALLLRWRGAPEKDGSLLLASAVFGLGLGVHHVTLALTLPGLAVLVAAAAGRGFFASRRLAIAALVATTCLVAVYLYLPWASSRGPLLDWGHPADLRGILDHITGRQYQSYFELSAASVGANAHAFLRQVFSEFGWPFFPLALLAASLGLVTSWRRDRALAQALGLLIACNLAFAWTYDIAEDKDAYYLPTLLALCLLAGLGVEALPRRARLLALVALPALALLANARRCDRSREHLAEDFARNALLSVPEGGTLLTSEWQLYSPYLYLREVEGLRRDAVVIDTNLVRRSWYVRSLERAFPAAWAAVRADGEAFLEDLTAWEADPRGFERDTARLARISARFHTLVLGLAGQAGPGRASATRDVALPGLGPDEPLARALLERFQPVPQGLVFQLEAPGAPFREPARPQLELRGLWDGSVTIEPDSPAALKVRPVYLEMLMNRGRYLAAHGKVEQARAAYDEVLALDPTCSLARLSRAQLP